MFINNFDPVAVEIFSLEIRWYSLSYIAGILIGWLLAKNLFINDKNLKDQFDDYLTYLIIGIILGGRIGYILFYNLNYYLENILDIFKIWQGGMSFHGGLIGIIIASYFFAKKYKNDVFKYLDIIALVAPIGIFFGRIANFINSELYGHEASVPWAVQFVQVDNLYRHPSQLYEAALEGMILFIVLINQIYKKSMNTGFVSALFMILYGLFRMVLEIFREPDSQIGYLLNLFSMGSVLSFVMILAGLLILKKAKNNDFSK